MTSWRYELVDNTGERVASIPEVGGAAFNREAMAIESFGLAVPVDSDAGRAIIDAPILPLLEVQIWRGSRLVVVGPIVEAPVDFATGQINVQCRGAFHHLDRTLTGPASMLNLAPNPTFDTDLAGWSRWLTTFDEIAGVAWETFDTDVTQITWAESGVGGVPNAPVAGVNWAKLDGSALAPDEELQLYHDEVVTASDLAPTRVTLRALFWLPPDQTFEPADPGAVGRTNLDHALIATVHNTAGDFSEPAPLGYFAFEPVLSVTRWGDLFAGRYEDIECSVEIPQGTGEWRIHLAMVPPRLVVYVTLVEITIDRPLELSGNVTGRVVDLIAHAQDAAYGHVDRAIVATLDGSPSTVVDESPIMESDRRTVFAVIDQAVDGGQVEWWASYTSTERTLTYGLPPQGDQLNRPVTITDTGGSGFVASATLRRMWNSGSTVVTGQASSGQSRSDVASTIDGDALAWEEVFVAPSWVARWDLQRWTNTRLGEVSHPEALELTLDPDHPQTEPWRDGTVDLLDRVPVVFDRDGITRSGYWQVRSINHDPTTDAVSVTLVPEVP